MLLFVLVLLPKIGSGTLWHHDELLTANRAREMVVRGDPWTVTLNFAPSVKKPPLQFWLCALLLRLLPTHPELAVRLPTLLAGAGCLWAAAWLAQVCDPEGENRAARVWTVLALAGCGYLIHYSRLALLDGGAALLLTLTLAGCQLARRRDARWWWFAALTSVLGAWQKAPYGLAAWIILRVANRWLATRATANCQSAASPARWRYHLPAALAVATLGALSWWLIKWLREDHALLFLAGYEQTTMFLRAHDPTDVGIRPWLYWGWLIRDWMLMGLLAPLAVVAALLDGRRHRLIGELGLVCVIFGGITACLVYRSERYLVVITPLLALLLVHCLQHLSKRLPLLARRWLLPAVLASTMPGAAYQYFKPAPARPDLLAAARELGRTAQAQDRVLICSEAERGFDTPEFVLFYANLRRPLEEVPLSDVEQLTAAGGPCRGICNREQWTLLRVAQPSWRCLLASGEWVLWTN